MENMSGIEGIAYGIESDGERIELYLHNLELGYHTYDLIGDLHIVRVSEKRAGLFGRIAGRRVKYARELFASLNILRVVSYASKNESEDFIRFAEHFKDKSNLERVFYSNNSFMCDLIKPLHEELYPEYKQIMNNLLHNRQGAQNLI